MGKKFICRGLKATSLFKLLFIGYAFSLGLLILIAGVTGLSGMSFFTLNGQPVVGVQGLMQSIIWAPLTVVFMTLFTGAMVVLGNCLYFRFRSTELDVCGFIPAPSSQAE